MFNSLWRQQILPFVVLLGALAAATLAGDYLLHVLDLAWVGRYLGIPGTILIITSLIYSLRKRKLIGKGDPKSLLKMHELSAWLGSLMVLIHGGVHFNAILPWLAMCAMGVNVISGMVGKLLLDRSRRHVQAQRAQFQLRGMPKAEVEQAVFWDAVALDAMKQWRKVHIPIFIAFAALSLGHIISVFLFWGWV
ncbi:hypothetical protein J5J83_22110 [Azoarcus sp. L1K30]|uniref:hypothetical protein n=1 Tax=Azoarcus sp. L1K30 TaxID=2820277 RepID=UPI001B841A96|nr:hypothetical protein [Azoarcus sp. L1K30]MBR0568829.1 hypothetical protein [Azoarcus sp. L1K30]